MPDKREKFSAAVKKRAIAAVNAFNQEVASGAQDPDAKCGHVYAEDWSHTVIKESKSHYDVFVFMSEDELEEIEGGPAFIPHGEMRFLVSVTSDDLQPSDEDIQPSDKETQQ